MKSIKEFYADQKIFITGATGFIGKTLLEKLLRTCRTESIYLLMRPKKGICTEDRLKELLQNPIFDVIRKTEPNVFQKVNIIDGDISQPNFGMQESSRRFLMDNMNIVFHCAATINFRQDLKTAVTLNTVGTRTILEMCEEMKQLKCFVYVSTAYCNPDRKEVREIVYKTPQSPSDVIKCVEILPQNVIDSFESNVLETYPNTYTFTKALAENLVLEFSEKIPAAIVRPSIGVWKDPLPGWVEGLNGATAVSALSACGVIKTILCDQNCTMDLIPVDVVVNTIITAAWHTKAYKSNSLRVYNCTSGSSNPITYRQYKPILDKWSIKYPSKYTLWYPRYVYRTDKFMHNLCCIWYHTIPAALMDILRVCTGKKPIMLKRNKKTYAILDVLSFFITKEWRFKTSTMETLNNHLKTVPDGNLFPVDISPKSGFDWNDYIKYYVLGIRQYIFKEDLSGLPTAKSKLRRLYWLQKLVDVAILCATLKLTVLTFQVIVSLLSTV